MLPNLSRTQETMRYAEVGYMNLNNNHNIQI